MTTKLLALVLFFAVVLAGAAVAEGAGNVPDLQVEPLFDMRARQEILDGVYHFDPGHSDRNWLRLRTRAGLRLSTPNHDVQIRLANENREFVDPEAVQHNWDEVIVDRAQWTWRTGAGTTLTVGRQDIIWNRGFLMLEGHALDGSRSIYHNAVRLQSDLDGTGLDLCLIHNPKYDPLVLVDDQDRALTDADETAVAARISTGRCKFSGIWKHENDPDDQLVTLRTLTVGARYETGLGDRGRILCEMAAQHQAFDSGAQTVPGGSGAPTDDGWALALQAFVTGTVAPATTAEAGFFYYSGDNGENLRAFRAPWGRWPKWSELYIYTLIGESTPGRVHVAAWENIAAPRLVLRHDLSDRVGGRFGATYLLAPEPDWQARGLLLQTGLEFDLAQVAVGLQAHLLWEMLEPGSFHTSNDDFAEIKNTVNFIRWQLSYTLK